jgi:hypothetical protein
MLFRSALFHHLRLQFSVCKNVKTNPPDKSVSGFTGGDLNAISIGLKPECEKPGCGTEN